jgi:hypothetical protein
MTGEGRKAFPGSFYLRPALPRAPAKSCAARHSAEKDKNAPSPKRNEINTAPGPAQTSIE